MSTNPTDHEALRRYLLGERPGPETDLLERRLLAEADLSELALAVEEELIEECVRGDLGPERCQPLLARLAASPAGRERIAFQRALGRVAAQQRALPPPVAFPGPWQAARRHPRIAASLAACLVAATIVGVAIGVGPGGPAAHPPRPGVVEEAGEVPPGIDAVVEVALTLAATRGGSHPERSGPVVVELRHPAQRIDLQFDVAEQPFQGFRAVLEARVRKAWHKVYEASLARADGGRTAVLHLPVIAAGMYRVGVEGVVAGGQPELIRNTRLKVVVQ